MLMIKVMHILTVNNLSVATDRERIIKLKKCLLTLLECLHLTLAHSKGQGLADFDCECVVNYDILEHLQLNW